MKGFNAASSHVLVLLEDAASAYERGSFGTATFLAITAIEEIAKAEMLGFRKEAKEGEKPKGRDPLRDHETKHRIAVRPTVFMSKRLVKAIGRESCEALKADAERGALRELRETALYVAFGEGRIITPAEAITQVKAKQLLLLALEVADDVLIGWTDESYRLTEPIDKMFSEMTAQ